MIRFCQSAIFLLLLVAAVVTGCRHAAYDPRLEEIDRVIAQSPDSALALLDRISADSLPEADRNLYNLLSIKARDKGNFDIASDSIILAVLDYYSLHNKDSYAGEAMYYGGRVYCDIGDYPKALEKFQTALEIEKSKKNSHKLPACIYSQIGWIHNAVRNYHEAEQYLIKAIENDRFLKDTLSTIYDLELLGTIKMHQKQYETADSIFRLILKMSENRYPTLSANQQMFLARISYLNKDLKTALDRIRPVVNNVHDFDKGEALIIAVDIYLKNGINDTAYLYARELVDKTKSNNKKLGYLRLLSPELRVFSSQEEIDSFISAYYKEIERYMSTNGDRAALIQNSQYNYRLHDMARAKAEKDSVRYKNWVIVILMTLLLFISLFFYHD